MLEVDANADASGAVVPGNPGCSASPVDRNSKACAPPMVVTIERLGVRRRFHHLRQRPRIAGRHRRTVLHGEQRRRKTSGARLDTALPVHRYPLRPPRRRGQVDHPLQVSPQPAEDPSDPEACLVISMHRVNEFVRPHGAGPRRESCRQRIGAERGKFDFSFKRKWPHVPI